MNIYDIAEIAGVSIATVSKALRDKPDISLATKERILAIAKENNYVMSKEAQSLAKKRGKNGKE